MKLYRLITHLGNYWVIAEDPTKAELKLKTVLDAGQGYGFSEDRIVREIHFIADQITHDPRSKSSPYELTKRFLLT